MIERSMTIAHLALLLAAAGAAAQEAPRPAFEDTLRVEEVLIDVLVTDAEGNVVIGLGADDFRVASGGEELPVAAVSFYSSRDFLGPALAGGAAPALEEEAAEAPVERHFVLLFHRPPLAAGGDPELQQRLPGTARRARLWLEQDLLPSDRVAVLGWDGELLLLQDFTRDREALARAIEVACAGGLDARRWPSRSAAGEGPSPLAARSWGAGEAESVIDPLPALAELLAELPGRKNLVLLGSDLPRPGAATGDGDGDPYRRAERALNDANVALYAVDLLGRGRQAGADRLAAATGGESFFRMRSALDPLRDIARRTSGYYLLAVRAPAGEGYRPLEVTVRHPELAVRARAGYRAGG